MEQNPSTEAQIPVNDPNGKMTVIELADENGGVAESITIRNDPSEILIGGQPVTSPKMLPV